VLGRPWGRMIGKAVRTSAFWRKIAPPPPMQPILLAPWGRNGSTLLMSLLASSPEVLVPEPYPFEHHQMLHFLRAAEVLAGVSAAPRQEQSTLMPGIFDGLLRPIEGLPVEVSRTGTLVSDLLAGIWDGWVESMRANESVKASVRYYAEKSTVEAARAFGQRRSGYCIFVSRDPRDIFASSKAFNQSRGNFEFGWSDKADPGFLQRGIEEMTRTLDIFESLPSLMRRIVIRYEDMVLADSPQVAELARTLGITISPERAAKIPSEHRTTVSPAASVGRWQRDLPPEMAADIRTYGERLFKRLGYD
jgi:hypothetical protein